MRLAADFRASIEDAIPQMITLLEDGGEEYNHASAGARAFARLSQTGKMLNPPVRHR